MATIYHTSLRYKFKNKKGDVLSWIEFDLDPKTNEILFSSKGIPPCVGADLSDLKSAYINILNAIFNAGHEAFFSIKDAEDKHVWLSCPLNSYEEFSYDSSWQFYEWASKYFDEDWWTRQIDATDEERAAVFHKIVKDVITAMMMSYTARTINTFFAPLEFKAADSVLDDDEDEDEDEAESDADDGIQYHRGSYKGEYYS